MLGAASHLHEPRFSYVLYPRDHNLVLPRHLLLAILRRSNNRLAPVRVETVHRLRGRVEDNLTCMPVMDGNGQEVEFMNSAFMAYADAEIAVHGCHVRHHVERDRERPALLQKLHDAL